jgi:glutaredoxin-related protein
VRIPTKNGEFETLPEIYVADDEMGGGDGVVSDTAAEQS